MLGGLVEYESSNDSDGDGEDGVKPAAKMNKEDVEERIALRSLQHTVDEALEGGISSSTSSDDSDEENNNETTSSQQHQPEDDFAKMAAADDAVEESLRMRIPESAQAEAGTPGLPPATPQSKQQQTLDSKRQQMMEKKRRILMLDAPTNDGDDDDEDEDAVKRRRIAAAAATGQLRGASSLLARLPKPKALVVREGGARILTSFSSSSAASSFAGLPRPTAATVKQLHEEEKLEEAEAEGMSQDNQLLLGAILPQRELHRYRQATGASLTADIGGVGGGGIVEIRQAEQLAGAELQMAKDLTRNADADPRRKPTGPAPNTMARRKHQITYLAFQAQERELELKNSWAEARFNQRSSQNKYGF